MGEFFSALFNPSIPFIRYAFLAGILSSIPFGIIGTWVTIKRISYLAGAIAHSVLAGIGMSLYFSTKYNLQWLHPLLGALFAAIVAALIIGFVSIYAKEREDTIIGAIWAIGMSLGLLFIAKTPGYISPMTYLFGNILIISQTDLILLIFLDVIIVVFGFLFYHQFQAITFDEEFARIRGIRTNIFYILLLLMTAVTVVLMTTIIGIVMVIALLTLPAAIAGFFAKKIWVIMLIAVGLTAVFTSFGLMISYMSDLPAGSTIILISGVVYLTAVLIKKIIL
jgi:zinc transport system permease protein